MIAEALIVQGQNARHVAQFEVEHGLMPP
jgi:hypothetical protein